jgi:hypothetical protein
MTPIESAVILKLEVLERDVLEYFDNHNALRLSPSGKYIAYLLTSAMLINRLKLFGSFQSGKVNIANLMSEIIIGGVSKYVFAQHDYFNSSYTVEKWMNYSLYKNCETFFKNSTEDIKLKSQKLIGKFLIDMEHGIVSNIYINLYKYPFFDIELSREEQKSIKYVYLGREASGSDIYICEHLDDDINEIAKQITIKLQNDTWLFSQLRSIKSTQTNKNCYIATMVYEDINHPKVEFLRQFRDYKLRNYKLGRSFIKYYYIISPKIVDKLKKHQVINTLIRLSLDNLILFLKFRRKERI